MPKFEAALFISSSDVRRLSESIPDLACATATPGFSLGGADFAGGEVTMFTGLKEPVATAMAASEFTDGPDDGNRIVLLRSSEGSVTNFWGGDIEDEGRWLGQDQVGPSYITEPGGIRHYYSAMVCRPDDGEDDN